MPLDLNLEKLRHGTDLLKRGFAKMQKGGVIMDVTNAEQAVIAEQAGAVAGMSPERVPPDTPAARGGPRVAGPARIGEIREGVPGPRMGKGRLSPSAEGAAPWAPGSG